MTMIQIDNLQKLGKDNVETALKTLGAVSKGTQAIAVEAADFAKKSLDQSTAAMERLAGVRSLDKALEVQTEYLKTAYEGFVAQSTRMSELYANLAREAYKPYEGLAARPGQPTV
jgi:phasin family protein